MSDELSAAWGAIQEDRVEMLLLTIGATWWRVHALAGQINEPWAWDLDAELLSTNALAREVCA